MQHILGAALSPCRICNGHVIRICWRKAFQEDVVFVGSKLTSLAGLSFWARRLSWGMRALNYQLAPWAALVNQFGICLRGKLLALTAQAKVRIVRQTLAFLVLIVFPVSCSL